MMRSVDKPPWNFGMDIPVVHPNVRPRIRFLLTEEDGA